MWWQWQKSYNYTVTVTWDASSSDPPEITERWSEAQPYVEAQQGAMPAETDGGAKALNATGAALSADKKIKVRKPKKQKKEEQRAIRKEWRETHKEERKERKAQNKEEARARKSERVEANVDASTNSAVGSAL